MIEGHLAVKQAVELFPICKLIKKVTNPARTNQLQIYILDFRPSNGNRVCMKI